jgi:hypothetical protein
MDLPVQNPDIKGFPHQLGQGQKRHDSSTNERGTKDQGRNRHLKVPNEKLEIQRHTVLYSGDDNDQDKQKSDD